MTVLYLYYCTICYTVRMDRDPPSPNPDHWLECKACGTDTIHSQIVQGNGNFFDAP